MKKVFTPDYIRKNKSCYELPQVNRISFIDNPEIHINDILNSEISLKDKGWFLVQKCELTNKQKADLAHRLAWVVLPIFEAKHPKDKRVRECLDAITQFNAGEITREVLLNKRDAAADAAAYAAADAAAYAAAYAADAAAADAADAAYAYADAYAADAAAYAAYAAAAYAAYADAAKQPKEITWKDLVLHTMLKFVEETN
jgi:hypothetical protein